MTRSVLFASTLAIALSTSAAHASDAMKACEKLKGDLVNMLKGEKAHGKTYATNRLTPGGKATFLVQAGGPKWQWVIRSTPIDKSNALDVQANPLGGGAVPLPERGVTFTACEFFAVASAGDWKHVTSTSQILTGDASRHFVNGRTVNAPMAGEGAVSDVLPHRIVVLQLLASDEKKAPLTTVSLKARPRKTALKPFSVGF